MFKKKTHSTGIGLLTIILLVAAISYQPEEHYNAVDTHLHIENITRAEVLLQADDKAGVAQTFLIPSPNETLTLNGRQSFTLYRPNVNEIFEIASLYPDRFIPFCTVSPLDEDAARYVRDCIRRGARGIKLYNGHSYYYEIFGMRLDDPVMMEIYEIAESENIPLLFHVNVGKYEDQLRKLLEAHPRLTVSVPHFMVSSLNLPRVAGLFDDFPNLYTDISFGSPEFMAAGFRRISKDPRKYTNFIARYSERFLFGTDMVLTQSEKKDEDFMIEVIQCYRDLLEKKRFECQPVYDYYEGEFQKTARSYELCEPKSGSYCDERKKEVEVKSERLLQTIVLNGLDLNGTLLKKIYEKNPLRFLRANQY